MIGPGSENVSTPSIGALREGVTSSGSLCGKSTAVRNSGLLSPFSPGEEGEDGSILSAPACMEMVQ